MSRDAPAKAEKDYTEILKDELPKIKELSKNDVDLSLEKLLILEKKTRQDADLISSKIIMSEIVDLLVLNGKFDELCEQLTILSKKHGQLKLSIQYMVQQVIKYLNIDDSNNENDTQYSNVDIKLPVKIKIIETIRTICENKIFVEVERARVSRELSKIKRSEGKIEEATDILCELQVETYGSMEMDEKIKYILEQMELNIIRCDYSQATVLSRKILKKTFNNKKYDHLKIDYYNLLIKIGLFKKNYLDIAQYYQEIYNTDFIKEDDLKWKDALTHMIYFLILSPFNNLQNDLINKIQLDNNVKKLEQQDSLLKIFMKQELMRWPIFKQNFETVLLSDKIAFNSDDKENNAIHWKELHKRIIEHNLRIISKYYSRITLKRLNELLDLSETETETYISDLVNQGIIYAKINRPARIVNFEKPKNSSDLLNEWSNNVDQLLENIETIGHLITKEEIMHGLKAK